jgi:hypothetical protein
MNDLTKYLVTTWMIVLLTLIATPSCISDMETEAIGLDEMNLLTPSTIVWSESFENDLDDWSIYGINHTADPDYLIDGNFSINGGVLRATGPEWNHASHNSSVAFGTWSFDVDVQKPVDEFHFYVAFSVAHFSQRDLDEERLSPGYAVGFYIIDTGPDEIRLVRGSHDLSPNALFMDYYYTQNIIGWHNIIITRQDRDPTYQFYVYMDGTLILEGRNKDYSTGDRFLLATPSNPAIDNITVSNTIDFDKVPPVWDERPSDQEIHSGEPFSYDLNATDYAGISRWWINDTQNFAISPEGVITNSEDLAPGEYGIAVEVNDTHGNTRTGTFVLTVLESTVTPPVEMWAVAIGIPVAAVLVIVIWKAKKR